MRKAWVIGIVFCSAAFAQTGERAPRPEGASNARVGGWCDALTGQKKEQCLRDERRKQKKKKKRPAPVAAKKKPLPAH